MVRFPMMVVAVFHPTLNKTTTSKKDSSQQIGLLELSRGRRRRRGLVHASGQGHPANARNLINSTSADAQAGARIVAGPANVCSGRRAVRAAGVTNDGGVAIAPAPFGNPVAVIQANIGVIANVAGPLVGAHIGGVTRAIQACPYG